MNSQRILIRLKGFDHKIVDKSTSEIVKTAKSTGARVVGPCPLPTVKLKMTVNRSPHVDKKSMDQFERRTHKRILRIIDPTVRTVESLKSLMLPAEVEVGVEVKQM